jgi:Flp pilus assembly pilin Flp
VPISRGIGEGFFMSIKQLCTRLIKDEEGQTTTEYILILAIAVMIAMKFKGTFVGKVEGFSNELGGGIDKQIKGAFDN